MSNFKFIDKTHQYFLDGKRLTGVTTILGVADFGKSEQLIQWSANQAVDHIENILKEGSSLTGYELKDARTAWKRTRDKAGDIGSVIHKLIEIYVKNKINKTEFHYERAKEDALLESNTELTEEEDKKIFPMFEQFLQWEKEDEIEFLLSEQKVYSRLNWYAGTVDLVFKKGGKIYLGDLKTAINVYLSNFTQMAGYDICLDELGKVKNCAGYCVINIPKIIDKNGNAFRRVKYDLDVNSHIDAFHNCLALYKYNNKNKNKYGTTRATKTGIKKSIKI